MRVVQLVALAFAAGMVPGAAAAQSGQIVVQGHAARAEIERILNADNLDTARMSPRDVVEAMAAIERGRAPDDFWEAYQAHVQAWEQLAAASEQAQGQNVETAFADGSEALAAAQAAIGTTFSEVERIALNYGARLPLPLSEVQSIV